jgi:hypothetical protein
VTVMNAWNFTMSLPVQRRKLYPFWKRRLAAPVF